jgi:hypothetical protein
MPPRRNRYLLGLIASLLGQTLLFILLATPWDAWGSMLGGGAQ